jgi:hypothetical protein
VIGLGSGSNSSQEHIPETSASPVTAKPQAPAEWGVSFTERLCSVDDENGWNSKTAPAKVMASSSATLAEGQ